MKYRRFSITDYIVYGLAAIGLLSMLVQNPGPILVPFLVFGIIILLYFIPQKFQKRKHSVIHPGGRKRNESRKKRQTGFRVIQGNKGPGDDEEPPRYH